MRSAVSAFNELPVEDAVDMLASCLHATDWVEAVLDARPYESAWSLESTAIAAARSLSAPALAEALAAHPRIGERPAGPGTSATLSRAEQSGVDDDSATQAALRAANVAYEKRFGHVFLIRAAGRDATEILAEARRRLVNDEAAEGIEVREQLGQIAVLRLRQLLERLA